VARDSHRTCTVVRTGETRDTLQGLVNFVGISKESVGAKRLCLHIVSFPPGARAHPHLHRDHETALYSLSGTVGLWFGDRLEHYLEAGPGDFVYIPANVPHQPFNVSDTEPATAVAARTDPNEQESVVLLPELNALHRPAS
jgi:uncharacterized RmlC-like cupin family protein